MVFVGSSILFVKADKEYTEVEMDVVATNDSSGIWKVVEVDGLVVDTEDPSEVPAVLEVKHLAEDVGNARHEGFDVVRAVELTDEIAGQSLDAGSKFGFGFLICVDVVGDGGV